MPDGIIYAWRGPLTSTEVNVLHAEGFGHRLLDDDWETQLARHSPGWICARSGAELVGFVNVAWDGGVHAFLLDTLVAAAVRHRGVGTRLVRLARDQAAAAGCEWLHVDFGPELAPFYLGGCGLDPTPAGVLRLRD